METSYRETLPPSSGVQTTASGVGAPILEPGLLATLLDQWAFKREKILCMLDLRAAHRARVLIGRCRDLEDADFSALIHTAVNDPRVTEWLEIRCAVIDLVRPGLQATGT